jgi:peptidyl-tRNA hydrolase, PTH1 family
MVLDRLAALAGARFQSSPKWQSHVAKLPGSGTLLLKPQTFHEPQRTCHPAARFRFTNGCPSRCWSFMTTSPSHSAPSASAKKVQRRRAQWHQVDPPAPRHRCLPPAETRHRRQRPRRKWSATCWGNFRPTNARTLENMLATAVDAVQLSRSQGIATAAKRFHTSNQPPTKR